MKYVKGFTILILFQLVGESLVNISGANVPGPLIGMLLLFAVLLLKKEPLEGLSNNSEFLLENLQLLVIPSGVGLMLHLELLRDLWAIILPALLLSTVLSVVTVSIVMKFMVRFMPRPDNPKRRSR